MEAINELGTAAFVMALITSFFALARLAMRHSATPAWLKVDGVCYFTAFVLTLGFATAMFLVGNVLATLMSPYLAIVLALAIQAALIGLAIQVGETADVRRADRNTIAGA